MYVCTCRMATSGPNKGNKGTVNILAQLAMSHWLALSLSLYTHAHADTQCIIRTCTRWLFWIRGEEKEREKIQGGLQGR